MHFTVYTAEYWMVLVSDFSWNDVVQWIQFWAVDSAFAPLRKTLGQIEMQFKNNFSHIVSFIQESKKNVQWEKKKQVQVWLFIGNRLIHEKGCYLLEWSQMGDHF